MYKTIEIRFSTSHAFPVWLQLVYEIVENKVREIGEYSPIKCPVTREKNIKSNYNYLSRVVKRKSKHCGSSKGIAIIEKKVSSGLILYKALYLRQYTQHLI